MSHLTNGPSNSLQGLFLTEFHLFLEHWKLLEQKGSDPSSNKAVLVSDLLDRLRSLEAGALLSKVTLEKALFDELRSALHTFEKNPWKDVSLLYSTLSEKLENQKSILFSATPALSIPQTSLSDSFVPLSEEKTMVDFFLIELEARLEGLNRGLLQLEQHALHPSDIEELMRAAHAIKGSARLVGLDAVVQLTHAMEDGFVALEKGGKELNESQIEAYLRAIDLLAQLCALPSSQVQEWTQQQQQAIDIIVGELKTAGSFPHLYTEGASVYPSLYKRKQNEGSDRIIRVAARSLNRLIGLAGECLIQSKWMSPFGDSLMKVKRKQDLLLGNLDALNDSLQSTDVDEKSHYYLQEVSRHANDLKGLLTQRLSEFETFGSRFSSLAKRLYQEVIGSRMRPFADGIGAFPRFIRDMAKRLGKQVRLIVKGTDTQVDREILEKLEAPLSHLLRNAVDHGIELPQVRLALGKDPEGTIILEAQHRAGALFITVADDGCGCDLEELRKTIVNKGLIGQEMALRLSEKELLEFLFLPGFSTADEVTEISGRGVGLSVVQTMVQEVGGDIHVISQAGKGITFSLQLPLTLSVMRALLVEIGEEIYAVPVARVHQLLFLEHDTIGRIEQKLYFNLMGENIGLVAAHHILGVDSPSTLKTPLAVMVLYDQSRRYGIVVDRVVGEQELVVHELDPILGKVANISAGSFMEDGTPLLILDVEDMMYSIEKLHQHGILPAVHNQEETNGYQEAKNILVVDDSATVREVESRILKQAGYQVETAVDGIDGWNALRTMNFDLVITDLDMPRMNGIEFVRKIKSDPRFRSIPVMIISYKENESDRKKGLEAGADIYLTKSHFREELLLKDVELLLKKTTLSDAQAEEL